MSKFLLPLALAGAASAATTNLYVTDYGGNVTSISLKGTAGGFRELTPSYTGFFCGGTAAAPVNPSWLTFDSANRVLYCLDEGFNGNGTLTSSKAAKDGKLTPIAKLTTYKSPVSGVFYGNGTTSRPYAVAHYDTSSVTTYLTTPSGQLTQGKQYTVTGSGPNLDRQTVPHIHEAILDPTGRYILTPDLGADQVRVWTFDDLSGTLRELPSLFVTPGDGPRHAAFFKGKTGTHLYVVTELTNKLLSFEVTYGAQSLSFKSTANGTSFGTMPVPNGAAAAEITVSPDNRFLTVSNRNDSSFVVPNYDPKNNTLEVHDSLATFSIQPDGKLDFIQLWPAGGSFPRQFSFNGKGDMIAVGLQHTDRVVVMERNIETGLIGNPIAAIPIGGDVTCVVWDEQNDERKHPRSF